jgi:hypothetical protein
MEFGAHLDVHTLSGYRVYDVIFSKHIHRWSERALIW